MKTTTHHSKRPSLVALVLLALITTFNLWAQESCELYCESKESTFMERCGATDNPWDLCSDAWQRAHGSCLNEQCSLEVELPTDDELMTLAEALIPVLFDGEYRVVSVAPHFYGTDTGEPGSLVFSLGSDEGEAAFLEISTSLEMPPVISFGTDLPAAEALHQRAVDSLTEAFGEGEYALERRFLTAAHPILEFVRQGQPFYYSVAFDGVSSSFALDDDPDANRETLAIRRQANKRQWRDYIDAAMYLNLGNGTIIFFKGGRFWK